MQRRELGQTGLQISPIGFGVWTISAGWWGDYSEEEAHQLLRTAYDHGINFFNTGNVYGDDGYGERLVRDALADVADDVVIGTTFGYVVDAPREGSGHRERPQDWSPDAIRRSLEQSLTNLGRDSIDVWQLHNPKMDAMQDDALWETLDALRSEGLVKAVGPSMGPRIGWRDEGVFVLRERNVDFVHHIFNLLEQDPGREFNELAAERNVGILIRVPHSSGLLEDQFTLETTFDSSDHRSHRDRAWLEEGLQKIDQIRFLLEDRTQPDGSPATMGQLALKWLLADPAITSAQPNFYDARQIAELAASPDIEELDADELGELDTLYRLNFGVEAGGVPVGAGS